jgi:hypothetical protein
MHTLGNLVLGAALAGVLAGPPVWSGAGQLVQAGITEARIVMGAPHVASPLQHALSALRSALPEAAQSAHLPN